MKKIKRLELRTGQVLNPLQQGFVVGGLDWHGNCTCQVVNVNTHTETATETIDDPNWVGVALGGVQVGLGVAEGALVVGGTVPTGGTSLFAIGQAIYNIAEGGASIYNSYNRTKTVHWTRTMKLINEAGKHKQISISSSICNN